MQLEQAIFTSTAAGAVQGYHLTARSAGVNEQLAAVLTQWGPSEGALPEGSSAAESLQAFPALDQFVVISRTMYGGPEYSGRSGLQVVTMMLVVRQEEFQHFGGNAIELAELARARGMLRLRGSVSESLPTLRFPDRPASRFANTRRVLPPSDEQRMRAALERLRAGERVLVIGCQQPVVAIRSLIEAIPEGHRRRFSFSTGLRPSLQRPYQISMLPTQESAIRTAGSPPGLCVVGEG